MFYIVSSWSVSSNAGADMRRGGKEPWAWAKLDSIQLGLRVNERRATSQSASQPFDRAIDQ